MKKFFFSGLAASLIASVNAMERDESAWNILHYDAKVHVMGRVSNDNLSLALKQLATCKTVSREWRRLLSDPLTLKELFSRCILADFSPEQSHALKDFLLHILSNPMNASERQILTEIYLKLHTGQNKALIENLMSTHARSTTNETCLKLLFPFLITDLDYYQFLKTCALLLINLQNQKDDNNIRRLYQKAFNNLQALLSKSDQTLEAFKKTYGNFELPSATIDLKIKPALTYESMLAIDSIDSVDPLYIIPAQELVERLANGAALESHELECLQSVANREGSRIEAALKQKLSLLILVTALRLALPKMKLFLAVSLI